MSEWESMTVAELKQELTRIGLPVSGKKTELISRLTDSEAEKIIFDAEIIEENQENGQLNKLIKKTKALPLPVLAVTGIMLLGTMGGAILYGDDFIDWIQGEPDYQLIDFDSTSARGYAQSLVDMGHPEWEGRMSGTTEEHNTADFIKSNFTTMGIPSTLEAFDVPMFVIDNEPELEICHPGMSIA